jgi:uncharacterized protein (TIGR00297 family)
MKAASSDHQEAHLLRMATACVAALFRFTAWWEAAILAGVVASLAIYIHRRIGRRSGARGTRTPPSIPAVALDALIVVGLIFLLPDRLDIVAAAWVLLGVGTAMEAIVDRRVPDPRLPWNASKSWAGLAALAGAGGCAAALACWWCRTPIVPPPYIWFSAGAPFAASLAAAAVTTIPIRLSRSISVPATAAALLWWASFFSEVMAVTLAGAALPALPIAVLANGAVALAGYCARTLTMPGAICGALLGTIVFVTCGWGGWILLFATFGMAVVTSRIGLEKKTQLGIAEDRSGRRGAGNALANTGVAAAAAILSAVSYAARPALIGFVAALAAAGSDTMASEVGKAWGRRAFLFPTLRLVPAGTSGAVSLVGTAAGLAGAVILSVVGVAGGLITWESVLPVTAGATLGAFAESAMGARLERPGYVNNDVLNFLNSAIAAGAAVLMAKSQG